MKWTEATSFKYYFSEINRKYEFLIAKDFHGFYLIFKNDYMCYSELYSDLFVYLYDSYFLFLVFFDIISATT